MISDKEGSLNFKITPEHFLWVDLNWKGWQALTIEISNIRENLTLFPPLQELELCLYILECPKYHRKDNCKHSLYFLPLNIYRIYLIRCMPLSCVVPPRGHRDIFNHHHPWTSMSPPPILPVFNSARIFK